MKKMRLIMALMAMMMLTVSCDDEKVIPAEQLPQAAKTYIEKNQTGANVLIVKKEREFLSTKYKVQLDNFMEIEFDGDGMVIDMDMD